MHLTGQKGCLNHGDWVTKKKLETPKNMSILRGSQIDAALANADHLPGQRCEMRSTNGVATSVYHDCWNPTDKSPKTTCGTAKVSIPESPTVQSQATGLTLFTMYWVA